MELEIVTTVWIDIDKIVERIKKRDKYSSIESIVDEYISGLDDCDYYLIEDNETEKIMAEVVKRLNK